MVQAGNARPSNLQGDAHHRWRMAQASTCAEQTVNAYNQPMQ
jgi:hypothetical protein